ncbi:four-helix bundle copper-binding protein [Alkalinema pantanalense CENA528]|uniref:four-helix bundle copper-binding protein n=1 Tax=Alkalinema pantanalense TaxID=1620705 RepID=UPI003D6FCDD2
MTTLNEYLNQQDQQTDINLLCLLRDCSEMCVMTVNLITDGSEFMGRTCQLCSEMCEKCAAVCESVPQNQQLADCAALCRRCAEVCKSMGLQAMAYFRRPNLTNLDCMASLR